MQWKDIVPDLDENGIDLLDKMLRVIPSERITAAEALKHKYFDDIPGVLKKLYNNT
jgi:serine/threonine protein kinase